MTDSDSSAPSTPITSRPITYGKADDPNALLVSITDLHPHGKYSLSGVSLRAFLLGFVAAFSFWVFITLLFISLSASQIALIVDLNANLAKVTSVVSSATKSLTGFDIGADLHLPPTAVSVLSFLTGPTQEAPRANLYRAPLFLSLLALFHFLEFYTTALTNTRHATTSSFLLSTNGRAYNIAHGLSFAEIITTSLFFPAWQARIAPPPLRALGAALVLAGQGIRTCAMLTAGSNFNHTVQTRRSAGHRLVTRGVYGVLRHPSYFGFFWWAVGTQIVVGNAFCTVGYGVVLTFFFGRRIRNEERYLVGFFGGEYVGYRGKSWVGIPFWWAV